jgi:replicative DNA helicase
MSARPESVRPHNNLEALRIPPQSVEAEQAVIGGLMLAPEAIDRVGDLLTESDFYRRDHRLIYRGIRELSEKNKPFDAVTLGEWFEVNGLSEQIGGPSYLIELASNTPSAANIRAYAEIVREKAVLRQLIEAGTEIVNDGFQPEGRDSQEVLSSAEQKVFKIAEQGRRGRADFVPLREAMKEAFQLLQERYENQGSVTGLPTGFHDFDEMTAGLQNSDLIILAARPAMGKCLSADAEIVQDDGSIATIEQIVKSRAGTLGTLDDSTFKLGRAAPSDFVDDGHKPTFEVRTRLGRRVETTAPHPFLTLDGWKPLLELSAGDYVAVPRRLPVFGEHAMRECEVKLLAYLIGDGGLTGATPRFTNSNPEIVADFEQALAEFGGMSSRNVEQREGFAPSYRLRGTDRRSRATVAFAQALDSHPRMARGGAAAVAKAAQVSVSSLSQWRNGVALPNAEAMARLCAVLEIAPVETSANPLADFLRAHGLMGQAAAAKQVPSSVFRLPRTQLAAFLNRLFATDGWATVLASGQAQAGYASVSERLARQVQHLLLRFGIVAKLRQRWVKYGESRRPAWQLDITDADSLRVLADEIGITGKAPALARLREALGKRRPHSNIDLIPDSVWARIDAAREGMPWAELARRIGASESNLHVGKRGLSRARLAKIALVLLDR